MSELNYNIEILVPNKVAAVRFSYIPFIQEISYAPDPGIGPAAYAEPLRITSDGLFLLNKDHDGYEIIKGIVLSLINLPRAILKQRRTSLLANKHRRPYDNLCISCISGEIVRRAVKKEAKQHGNN